MKNVKQYHTIKRGCGCPAEMPEYKGELPSYLEGRRARMITTRCTECGQKANHEHNALQIATAVKKGQEVKMLPPGTIIVLRRRDDGEDGWLGYLGDASCVNKTDAQANGLMSLVSKLAKQWCKNAKAGGK